MLFVINNPEVYKSPNSNTYMYVESTPSCSYTFAMQEHAYYATRRDKLIDER